MAARVAVPTDFHTDDPRQLRVDLEKLARAVKALDVAVQGTPSPSTNPAQDTLMTRDGRVEWASRALVPHAVGQSTLGLWQLRGVGVGQLTDTSGNGFDLAVEAGTERYTYIHKGLGGVYLDGATTLWRSAADAALRHTGDMTFMCFLVLHAMVNNGAIFSHANPGETANDNWQYGAYYGTAPNLLWLQESGAGTDAHAVGGFPVANMFAPLHQVIHVAWTRIGGVVTTYLDGSLWGSVSGALTTPTGGTAGRFRLFGDGSANRLTGVMASARLQAVGLTPTQIKAERNRAFGDAFGRIS